MSERMRGPEVQPAPSVIGIGSIIEIHFMDAEADEIETIQLGSRQSKDNTGTTAQVVSPNTPLGMAILNKKAGETVSFRGPSGDMIGVKIIFVR